MTAGALQAAEASARGTSSVRVSKPLGSICIPLKKRPRLTLSVHPHSASLGNFVQKNDLRDANQLEERLLDQAQACAPSTLTPPCNPPPRGGGTVTSLFC